MNPFIQKIGICYVDEDWATYIMNTIVEEAKDCVEKYFNSKYNRYIQYKDGTTIHFFKTTCEARGRRYTKVYIQNKDLDKNRDFILECVIPGLTLGDNPECYIIDEYEDIRKGHNTTYNEWLYRVEYGDDWRFYQTLKKIETAYKYKEIYHDNN